MTRKKFNDILQTYKDAMNKISNVGIGKYVKIESVLCILNVLEDIFQNQNNDPWPPLVNCISNQIPFLEGVSNLNVNLLHDIDLPKSSNSLDQEKRTKELFEDAWTIYDRKTYDHSVQLIKDRLLANGFDREFFAHKTCLDGGCGTARFAIAMAQLGAEKVVAADIGKKSIDFAAKMINDYGLANINLIVQDVTDLSNWPDNSFDFVVSNGVLHHAVKTEKGIKEHFRITKSKGTFWLYLYGAGGIYWSVYDEMKKLLKDIDFREAKRILLAFNIRQGAVYTFLDNIYAPIRKYYYLDDIIALLKENGDFTFSHLKGSSAADDTELLLKTKYGKEITGPQGEVRIKIIKC